MTNLKGKNKLHQNRRQFIAKVSLGTAAVAGLSSCEISDLNFIGKLKSNAGGPPDDKDIAALVKFLNLNESIEKIVQRMKKNVFKLKKIPAGMQELFSDSEVNKLIENETQFYITFYKNSFTAGEVHELVKIFSSKIWKKYTESLADLNSTKLGDLNAKPSSKFVAKVNALLSSNSPKDGSRSQT